MGCIYKKEKNGAEFWDLVDDVIVKIDRTGGFFMKKKLPYMTILLFTLFLIILFNFNTASYIFNPGAYKMQEAKVESSGMDGLFSVVPQAIVTYSYNKKEYKTKILAYEKIFNKNKDFQKTVNIAILKKSPTNIMYIHNFFSIKNILLLCVCALCVIFLGGFLEKKQYLIKKEEREDEVYDKKNKDN